MAVDTGIVVAVVADEFLQTHGGFRQTLYGEGHILNKAGGAHGTGAADTGEDAGADGPVLAVDGRVFSKFCRYVQAIARQAVLDGLNLLQQLLMGDTLCLGQYSCQPLVVARFHAGYLSCIHIFLILQVDGVVNRTEGFVVEHLGTLDNQLLGTHLQVFIAGLQLLHGHHGFTALFHSEEIDHGRSLEGVVVKGLHGDLRDKGQRTLRAYHQVGNDVEGVVVGYQRTQVQTGNILDTVLAADAPSQRFVVSDAVAEGFYLADKVRVTLAESLATLLTSSIEHCSVGQDDTGRYQHAVAVGMDTTVHARGVVTHNTADHCRADAGRVGREYTSVGFQYLVDLGTDNAGLQADGVLSGAYLVALPVLASYNEYGVAQTLTRERRSSRPEGEGQVVLLTRLYNI